jgi:PAS domain S-box-containing protein
MEGRRVSVALVVTTVLVTVTTLVLLAFGTVDYLSRRRQEWGRLRSDVAVAADQLAVALALPIWNIDRAQIDKVIEGLASTRFVKGVSVTAAGRMHARVRDQRWSMAPAEDASAAGEDIVEVRPIVFTGEQIGVLRIVATPRFVREKLRGALVADAVTIFGTDVVLILGVYFVLWLTVVRPLRAIERYAAVVSEGGRGTTGKAVARELDNLRSSIETMVDLLHRRYTDLQEHTELFSKVFRSNPAFMLIARTEGRGIVDMNDTMLEACGFTREEVVGRTGVELGLWDPERRDFFEKKLSALGRLQNELTEIETRRGRRSLLMSAEGVEVRGEKLNVVMAHDVTERLEAERALRESEQRLRISEEIFSKVFRASPASMAISVLATGKIIDVNESFTDTRGYTREELIGKTALEAGIWVSSKDRERFAEALRLDGHVRDFVVESPTKAGTRLSLLVSAETVEIGGERCIVTISEDITDWLRAERRLKGSEERLRLALTAARMGAWDWTAATDAIGWSDRENAVCGFLPGTLIGTFEAYMERVYPEDRKRLAACVARARGGTTLPYVNEHRVLQPDGGHRWVESRGQGFSDGGGRPSRIVGTITDMSERKQLEEQLSRQEKLASIGSLVAGVAHEVRTPLFGISATLDAFEGGTPDEHEEAARLLRGQVKRLSTLMSDLLDYGRPPVLQMERGSVADVAVRAMKLCEPLAAEHGVSMKSVLPPGPMLAERDSQRLEQALQNLIANAIQFSPRGGEVRVVLESARRAGCDYVSCRVEDQGPGLPADASPRLFEPFFTSRKGGTGLGLAIVQRIIEAHGGTVTGANRPGGGAAFAVMLPAYVNGTS